MSIRPLHFQRAPGHTGKDRYRIDYGLSSYSSDDGHWVFNKWEGMWHVDRWRDNQVTPYYPAAQAAGIFDTGFPRLADAIAAVETITAAEDMKEAE